MGDLANAQQQASCGRTIELVHVELFVAHDGNPDFALLIICNKVEPQLPKGHSLFRLEEERDKETRQRTETVLSIGSRRRCRFPDYPLLSRTAI